jgi:hypothetical protein
MKNRYILRLALFMVAICLFSTCSKLPVEKSQDAYSASKVIPAILGTNGAPLALQTFKYMYSVTYFRAGSKWNWTVTDATIDSISPDTRSIRVLFNTLPASDTALIKVTETTSGGNTTPETVIKVRVNPFCPLAIDGFVGTWTGTDGQGADYTYPGTITTTLSETKILVGGINVGFMEGFWGETIVAGGTCLMTVNSDGTVDIPEQYFCDTDFSAGYKIKGSGTWDNCGAKPNLIINYDVWYPDSGYWIAAHYKSYLDNIDHLTATITLD